MPWTLDTIEGEARATGCEVLFGPQRIKFVRTVVEYAPYPGAGPGRWQVVQRDAITEAALDAARSGITADTLTVPHESDFSACSLERSRFASVAELLTAVETDTRTRGQLIDDEPQFAWVFLEYRLWKTDNWEQLPLVDDFRRMLDVHARYLYRPRFPRPGQRILIAGHGKRKVPREATQHVFELFGIDWKSQYRPPDVGAHRIREQINVRIGRVREICRG
jgi:hypothetical protein